MNNDNFQEAIKRYILMRNQQIKAMQKISLQYNLQIKPALTSAIETVVKQLKLMRVNESIAGFQDSLKRLRQGIIETEEDVMVFKSAMVEMGYPPHDSLSVPQMRIIAKEYKLHGKELIEQIDQFMISYYSASDLQKMLYRWEDKDIIKKRMPLLRNVIMSHNIGMYDLVVPSLLSQFEGLLFDSFQIKGESKGRIITILLRNLLLNPNSKTSAFDFNDAIHKYYSEQILEGFEHGKNTKHGVSRHAVLHGSETDFGKSNVSLKVILLFDYLLQAINELEDEQIRKAQLEVKQYRKWLERQRNKKKRK